MDTQTMQERIEKDLFDVHHRILEKFHSLINLIFASAGFSFALINYSRDKSTTFQEELGTTLSV